MGLPSKVFRKTAGTWSLFQMIWISVFSVGMESFWAFPILLYSMGGAGFLVVHYSTLLLLVFPAIFVQCKLGSLTGSTAIGMFSRFAPLLKGVAMMTLLLSFGYCIGYGVWIGLLLYYMFAMMIEGSGVWDSCENAWNTPACSLEVNVKDRGNHAVPSEEYFWFKMWKIDPAVDEASGMDWYLPVCVLIGWLLVFLITCLGPRLYGKIINVLAPSTLVVLLLVLVRGATTPESSLSAKATFMYHENDSKYIKTKENWGLAVWTHIWATGIYFGIWPTIGKHSKSESHPNIPPAIFVLVYATISLGVVCVVGTFIGTDLDTSDGVKLLFVKFPNRFRTIPLAEFWAALFYATIVLFALQSQALRVLTIQDNITHGSPENLKRNALWTAFLALGGVILSLPIVTNGGYYFFLVFNYYNLALVWLVAIIVFAGLSFLIVKLKPPIGLCYKFGMWSLILVPSAFIVVLLFFVFFVNYIDQPYLDKAISLADATFTHNVSRLDNMLNHGWKASNASDYTAYSYPEWTKTLGWFIAAAPIVVGLVVGTVSGCCQARPTDSVPKRNYNEYDPSHPYHPYENVILDNKPSERGRNQEHAEPDSKPTKNVSRSSEVIVHKNGSSVRFDPEGGDGKDGKASFLRSATPVVAPSSPGHSSELAASIDIDDETSGHSRPTSEVDEMVNPAYEAVPYVNVGPKQNLLEVTVNSNSYRDSDASLPMPPPPDNLHASSARSSVLRDSTLSDLPPPPHLADDLDESSTMSEAASTRKADSPEAIEPFPERPQAADRGTDIPLGESADSGIIRNSDIFVEDKTDSGDMAALEGFEGLDDI